MLTLWLTVLSLGCAAQVAAQGGVVYTNGTSGELCGGQRCISPHATCQDGQCVCQSPYSEGIGTFHCYKPGDYFCAIFNDPMIIGFDGTHVKAPFITFVSPAALMTGTCANSTPTGGQCSIQVGLWGGRLRGKTFVQGYFILVSIVYMGQFYQVQLIGHTSASSGTYSHTYNISPGPLSMPGHAPITITFDEVNNFDRITLEACGVDFGMRGVERDGDPLLMPAGAYITVRTDCGSAPMFGFSETNACSAPAGKGVTLDEFAEQLTQEANYLVSREKAMLYKLFKPGGIIQSFPNAPTDALETLLSTVSSCPLSSLFEALDYCSFCIESPRFFRCYDPTSNGENAIDLMTMCISAICDQDVTDCLNVRNTVQNSNCAGGIQPNQLTILDYPCFL